MQDAEVRIQQAATGSERQLGEKLAALTARTQEEDRSFQWQVESKLSEARRTLEQAIVDAKVELKATAEAERHVGK